MTKLAAEQSALVAGYFDKIATGYRSRYAGSKPFHNYFFRERLRHAIGDFDLNGKSVLDIGAGTGALYEELTKLFRDVDYFACDISAAMLAESAIPASRSFVGRASDIDFPRNTFDLIFSLGVTTYQTPVDLADDWQFIADNLSPDGIAVMSFTNRSSVDHFLRSALRGSKPFLKTGILGQAFDTFAYQVGDVRRMAKSVGLNVSRSVFFNHTFSPFGTLLPAASVKFAGMIANLPQVILPALSADMIVFITRDRNH